MKTGNRKELFVFQQLSYIMLKFTDYCEDS